MNGNNSVDPLSADRIWRSEEQDLSARVDNLMVALSGINQTFVLCIYLGGEWEPVKDPYGDRITCFSPDKEFAHIKRRDYLELHHEEVVEYRKFNRMTGEVE